MSVRQTNDNIRFRNGTADIHVNAMQLSPTHNTIAPGVVYTPQVLRDSAL